MRDKELNNWRWWFCLPLYKLFNKCLCDLSMWAMGGMKWRDVSQCDLCGEPASGFCGCGYGQRKLEAKRKGK